jgi:hypothetical protein
MRKVLMILGFSACALACEISVNEAHDEPFDDWDDDSSLSERAADTCDAYCLELIDCGALSDGAFVGCRDHCVEKYEEDEDTVYDGCSCVMDAQCEAEVANECEGAPLPGIFPGGDGTGGSTTGTWGVSDGGQSPGLDCSVDHDCAIGEDCIEGSCMPRCVASCQCDEGQACVDGYCDQPEEPVVMCANDCDCSSGESCVDGLCK